MESSRHPEQARITGSRSEIEVFATQLVHELRQPLATAMNLVGLVEDDLGKVPDAIQRERLAQLGLLIRRTGEIPAAQTRLHGTAPRPATLRAVAVWQLVAGALTELEPELEQARAQLTMGPLPWLRADPGLLQQLFRNVIENAVRYRRPDASLKIHIRARPRPAPDPRWEIEVRDNGRGFCEADAEAIFAPFEQLGRGCGGGEGLGLALCRRIAELHGGTLTAHGRPGSGATFTLCLPGADPVPGVDDVARQPIVSRAAGRPAPKGSARSGRAGGS